MTEATEAAAPLIVIDEFDHAAWERLHLNADWHRLLQRERAEGKVWIGVDLARGPDMSARVVAVRRADQLLVTDITYGAEAEALAAQDLEDLK